MTIDDMANAMLEDMRSDPNFGYISREVGLMLKFAFTRGFGLGHEEATRSALAAFSARQIFLDDEDDEPSPEEIREIKADMELHRRRDEGEL